MSDEMRCRRGFSFTCMQRLIKLVRHPREIATRIYERPVRPSDALIVHHHYTGRSSDIQSATFANECSSDTLEIEQHSSACVRMTYMNDTVGL